MPLSTSTASVAIFDGSEPTDGSVRAKALIVPLRKRGKYFFFWASVPNSLSGCGTPIDWCALTSTAVEAQWLASSIIARL